MPTNLTPEIINAAILGFEEQKKLIDTKLAELRAMQSSGPAVLTAKPEPRILKRRTMSAEGRKAIAEATKNRWAAFHAAKHAATPEQAEPEEVNPKKSASKQTAMKASTPKAARRTSKVPAPAVPEAATHE